MTDETIPVDERDLLDQAERARIVLARRDCSIFNAYVLRDEETGLPVANAPIHTRWHKLADAHDRLVIHAHIESGKSNSITIGRSLYTLGRDHNQRVCVVSASSAQAVKLVRSAAKYIEESKRLRRVFPSLRPSTPWTHNAITIERDVATIKDPSLQGLGVRGALIGARVDLLILDDILNYENTRTREQRDELRRWYYATFSGRITRRGRILAVGTAWHPQDLMFELAGKRGFVHYSFPVIDPTTGEPTWPERWPKARIEQRAAELGEVEAQRQLYCRGVDEGSTRFKKEWFKACLRLGDGIEMVASLDDVELPEGAFCVTGLDLGFSKKRRGAKTVFYTTLFYPDGQRQPLWIEAGDFSGPEIVRKVLGCVMRFKGPVFVENNGAQRLVLNFALDPIYLAGLREEFGPGFDPASLPVYPFQTGSNKWDPAYGIESMATELERGRWLIPNDGGGAMPDENGASMHPEVANWIADVMAYNPNQHTGDYLMAWWIGREGARSVSVLAKRRRSQGVRVLRARSTEELARERAAKIEAEEKAAEAARNAERQAERPTPTE